MYTVPPFHEIQSEKNEIHVYCTGPKFHFERLIVQEIESKFASVYKEKNQDHDFTQRDQEL